MTKYVRFEGSDGGRHYGELHDGDIYPLEGEFGGFCHSRECQPLRLETVTLLAPTIPTKIIAVGPNFMTLRPGMSQPLFWNKPSTCVNDPEGTIELPREHSTVNHEVELAVVIGKRAKMVELGRAHEYIFGYTCTNDVTAGDLSTEEAWMASHYFVDGKIFDGFAPLGPWIETDLDTDDLQMECRVNGVTRQSASTRHRVFSPAELVVMLSQIMTLLPGDVISTGSPPGEQPIVDGDVVEVEIEGIGVLRNYARSRVV